MSNIAKAVWGAVVGIIVIIGILFVVQYFSTRNTEAALRLQFNAKVDNCMLVHDEMKKKVQEIGNVASDYMTGFDTMYTKIIGSRYDKGDGTLMKWIKESNPQFDNSLYLKLANVIEAERAAFKSAQAEAVDVKREHDLMLKQVPSRWFLGGVDTLKLTLVTGTATQKAFETGVDDEVYGGKRK